jgi:NAD(P)-dependent dehydrogenase (short-subunit alcohol dehydrogenase family)
MAYFLTGATGFIGRHLVAELTKRGAPVHILVRPGSRAKVEGLLRGWGESGRLVVPVYGDLSQGLLGVAADERAKLRGGIDHFFHLGALYDLEAEAADLERANTLGTQNALDFAHDLGAGCFHLVSSIAAAGSYDGTFTEDMFDEAEGLDHPYFRTKHDSEAMVRKTCRLPWRVYRPGMVVGHSATGKTDKIDGPYYFFEMIQKLRDNVPRWVPLIGFEGGHVNLVPVDFVAAALAHLAHVPGQDRLCFHLTDPVDRRVGQVLNLFAKAAHAPTMTLRIDPSLLAALPDVAGAAMGALRPLRRIVDEVMRDLRIPRSIVGLLNHPTIFDSTRAQALLKEAGIRVPRLEDYAWRLWDYWERQLDPDLFRDKSLSGAVKDKVILITGGSSGIGRATAIKVADAGAHVVIVARDPEKLDRTREDIASRGGKVSTYSADIAEPEACERVIAQILREHERVDILINNAGRSIRRAIENSYNRLHDYERLMRLNYFAAVQVTLGILPSMVARGAGHVISISSIGVLSNAPRFAGYNASKAALEAFSRCAAAEYSDRGVRFTVINMPLVRTPMVAPTRIYQQFSLISPEQAADIVCEAIIYHPQRLATRLGIFAQVVGLLTPKVSEIIMNESFKMYPESEAAGGAQGSDTKPSTEALAFASIMKGIHW